MKFKEGDKVRITITRGQIQKKGEEVVIIEVDNMDKVLPYRLKLSNKDTTWVTEEDIELIEEEPNTSKKWRKVEMPFEKEVERVTGTHCTEDEMSEIINAVHKDTLDKLLVSFGNYLLSEERKGWVREEHQDEVHHSDLENWKESLK